MGGVNARNLIVGYGPDAGPVVVVGAHYDVCGDQDGADDNASAVASLLELARLLAERRPPVVRRIELVAFTLEEPPFFRTDAMGSAVHARSLRQRAGHRCVRVLRSVEKEARRYRVAPVAIHLAAMNATGIL